MATRKKNSPAAFGRKAPIKESVGTVLATFAGPSTAALAQNDVDQLDTAAQQRLATQRIGAQAAAAAMPANPLKAAEHGVRNGHAPQAGQPIGPHDPIDTASTVTEDAASPKVGRGKPQPGYNPGNEPLDRARVDSGGQVLTTNMGAPVADNQNSLKAGLRGPTLLEDFILREKITHFDHERIPERDRARARLGRARLLRVLPADLATYHARRAVRRGRQAHAGVRPLLDRRRRARLDRHSRATCAASPSSSTPTKATGTSSATTSRCSSSRTR